MKKNVERISIIFFVCSIFIFLSSCEKDELKYVQDNVTPKIYVSGSENGIITIKSDNPNLVIDKAAQTVTVALGINRSGIQKKDGFSVKFSTSNSGLPDGVIPITSSDYTAFISNSTENPTELNVQNGETYTPFYVKFSKSLIDNNPGKKVGFKVVISDPTKYQLHESLSTVSVIIDVASFEERAVNVTSKYLKNAGGPFTRDDNSTSRFGILKDWDVTESVKNIGGKGGFDSYGGGGYLAMERWGTPAIPNGKIYQAVTLPKGKYKLDVDFEGKGISGNAIDQAFVAISEGASLPDAAVVSASNTKINWNMKNGQNFTQMPFNLEESKQLTFGITANLISDSQYFRLRRFTLYKYESPFLN